MDSLTQIALGAAVGEAVLGKKVGNKAIFWGAVAGTIPDLDVIGSNFMSTVEALEFHRGMTHSIVFAIAFSPLLGFLIYKIHKNSLATWKDWTFLSFMGLVTHPLLDCFTTWGTQLFWPFSDYRVAFKSIFVIDPLYTLPLLICLIWLMLLSRTSKKRRKLNKIGLILSSTYLLLTVIVKQQVNSIFEQSFEKQNIPILRYETKPAPLNIILWAVTAEVEDGYYIGYYGFLDDDKDINYFFFPKQHQLFGELKNNEGVQKLTRISDGWYTLEATENGIIYNDLRFGQRTGWETGDGKFVFSYRIFIRDNEVIIEEVKKEMNEGKAMLKALWERVKGE